jgi:hypothetical protein
MADDEFARFMGEVAALEKPKTQVIAAKPVKKVISAKPQLLSATTTSSVGASPAPFHQAAPSHMIQPAQPAPPKAGGALSGFFGQAPPPEPEWGGKQGEASAPPSCDEAANIQSQQSAYNYEANKHKHTGAGGQQANLKRKCIRASPKGEIWRDDSLADWPDDDYRIFAGDIGNEVTDELLSHAFSQYPSMQKAKVVRNSHTGKSKGYGFISFSDPYDFAKALREMNGKYIGNRPAKLKKSSWQAKNINEMRKKKRKEKKDKLNPFSVKQGGGVGASDATTSGRMWGDLF